MFFYLNDVLPHKNPYSVSNNFIKTEHIYLVILPLSYVISRKLFLAPEPCVFATGFTLQLKEFVRVFYIRWDSHNLSIAPFD